MTEDLKAPHKRKIILTRTVMATIPALVAQGNRANVIATMLGCQLTTLKVRCSQEKISLRTPDSRLKAPRPELIGPQLPRVRKERLPNDAMPRPIANVGSRKFTIESSLTLSRVAMARLAQRAAVQGVSEAQLATALLEVIAQDDLYDAVLDSKAA